MRDPLNTHLACVETLHSNGVEAPREWLELRGRLVNFIAAEKPCTCRLAEEIVTPSGADLDLLRAAALAEQTPSTADVNNVVRAAVHTRLAELYAPQHAGRSYRAAADKFNDIAKKFTACADLVDVDGNSDTIVGEHEKVRRAWLDGAVHARALTDWLPVLCAAAELAGAVGVSALTEDADPLRLALVCDAGRAHRRKVWTAWAVTGGRTGRWGALHTLGVKLRAHPHPDRLDEYRRPLPLQGRWVPAKHGGHEQLWVDPEDNPRATIAPTDADEWSVA